MPSGPQFFRSNGPVPVTLQGFRRGPMPPGARTLGDLPQWDRSRPMVWPTNAEVPPFSGPASVDTGLLTALPGAAPSAASPTLAQRQANLANFANVGIQVSTSQPVWQANYYRCFLLIQNLDATVTLLVSFGTSPSRQNALQVGPGIGFFWDSWPGIPNNSVYVGGTGVPTVNPIGIEGTQVDPSSLPL